MADTVVLPPRSRDKGSVFFISKATAMRRLVAIMLRQNGYAVQSADHDAREVMRYLKGKGMVHLVDVVIVDEPDGDLDGLPDQLLQESIDLPVLALSATQWPADLQKDGYKDVIPKPVDAATLLSAVGRQVAQRSHIHP